jgi:hypothetical protein
MTPDKTITTSRRRRATPEPFFTLERANRSLVLVRPIVAGLVTQFRELTALQAERERLACTRGQVEQIETLEHDMQRHAAALNALNQELLAVGCVLKDWGTGLVDFPAQLRGRRVWLCWKLGEPAVTHWHEWDAGYAGRRTIGPDWPPGHEHAAA